jgi:hypothetical protein
MRVTLLTFFFALSAFCATADQIDNLVTNLPDGWDGGQTPMVNLPETSSVEQVLRGVFKVWWFDDSHVTNFTVLKSRQVTIPRAHSPGAFTDSYTAALVETNHGKKIVLFRYWSWDLARGWWSRVYDEKPSA